MKIVPPYAFATRAAVLLALAAPLALSGCFFEDDPSVSIGVTPAKGAISEGASCQLFNAITGALLSTSKTDSTGTCSLTVAGYSGPIAVKVCGGTGVTYFDETLSTPANVAMSAANCLLAAAPSIPTGGAPKIGVTPLTHLGAVLAGMDPNSTSPKAPSQSAISDANTKVKVAILGGDFSAFDILDAPAPPRLGTTVGTGDAKASLYGAFIAALSKSIVTAGVGGTGNVLDRFSALATEFQTGGGKFTTPDIATAVRVSAAQLQAVANSFYGPALTTQITNVANTLKPNSDGTGPKPAPTETGTGTGTGTGTSSTP
jgi:hypothetical protein